MAVSKTKCIPNFSDGPNRLPILGFAAVLAVSMALSYASRATAAGDEASLWAALGSGGHLALLRHAIAPGTGDPADFTLRDCSTQRNLSEAGRAQANRIGERFRSNGIDTAKVFSSQWCRCLETAKLLGLGPVNELPPLNSFFQNQRQRGPQTRALETWLAGQELAVPLVLVTHQVNITELTGVFPASGELVIVRWSETGGITVVGKLRTE